MADQLYAEAEGRERLGNLGRTKYFELLKVGRSAEAKEAEKGLRSVQIGRRRMVPQSEIDRFIARELDGSTSSDPRPAA